MRTDLRLHIDGQPASAQELAAIESIVVEQEIDAAWEARLQILIDADRRGQWREGDRYAREFARVRVEVRRGEGDFEALIDGPVVERASELSSEPGQSTLSLTVRDDSAYLNRRAAADVIEEGRASAVARRVFAEFSQIAEVDVEDTPPAEGDRPPATVQQGTAIELLRALARRHGMHAYVLPGERPGRSVGVFRGLPTRPSDLPEIVVMGARRNVERVEVEVRSDRPARVIAETLSLGDKAVIRRSSSSRDLALLGDDPAVDDADQGEERLPPGQAGAADAQSQVDGEARRRSYAVVVRGELRGACYGRVLQPYRVVRLRGATARMSGDYTIFKVTHTLSRSEYVQAFSLGSNSRAPEGGSGGRGAIPQGVF